MSDKILDVILQYGLSGMILGGLFYGVWKVGWWWLEKIIEPKVQADLKAAAADKETTKKLAETTAAIGLTAVNIDRGVGTLLIGGQETRIEFAVNRRAWRLVAEIVEAHANEVQNEELRDQLKVFAVKLRDAMDDGSREMRALSSEDESRYGKSATRG